MASCCSVTLSCLTLCNPMDCIIPGFPVLQCLLEFAQTHAHWVDDAIQPSRTSVAPFSYSHSFPASGSFPMSQLFTLGGLSIELQLQPQFFQWIFRVDFISHWLSWSPCCWRDSWESSPAPHFESFSSLALSLPYGPTLTSEHDYWKDQSFNYTDLCQQSDISAL